MARRAVELGPRAVRDLRRVGTGPELNRLADALRSPGESAPNLDIKDLEGHGPWLRLRVGDWRILFRPAGDRLWVERIVNRRDLMQAVRTLG